MLHNKKSCFSILMMFVALGILLGSLAMPSSAQAFWWQDWFGDDFWWQQEIPTPNPCQTINPDYVNKRNELTQAWNQLHRQNNLSKQSRRWTQRTYPKYKNDKRTLKKLRRFEQELKKTPMYLYLATPTPECEAAWAAAANAAVQTPTSVTK